MLLALLAASAIGASGKAMLLNRNRSPPPPAAGRAAGRARPGTPPAPRGSTAAASANDARQGGRRLATRAPPAQSSDSLPVAEKIPASLRTQHGCTMDERTLATLTEDEFRAHYYLKRPVVIRQAVAGDWPKSFSRDALQRDPGSKNMDVTAMQMIGDTLKSRCDGVKPVNVSLGAFLDGMTVPAALAPTGKNAMTEAPWQVFCHAAFLTEPGQALDAMVREGLPDWVYTKAMSAALSVGGPDAGTQFHKHSDGFSLLFSGHKRWWMSPHDSMPMPTFPADNIPIKVWMDEIFPGLDPADQPSHCVQGPGDLVYVPDGFYHATVNLDDTIGMAAQNLMKGPIQGKVTQQINLVQYSALQELARAKLCRSMQDCNLIATQAFYDDQPDNNAGPGALATTLRDNGRLVEAIDMAEESIRRNPKHADSFTRLANFMLLDVLQPLINAQSSFDEFPPAQDIEQKRRIIDLLQKAHELNPLDFKAQDSLVVVYEVSGDGASEQTRHWEKVRDGTLQKLEMGSACLRTQATMFSVIFAGHLQGRGEWLPAVL